MPDATGRLPRPQRDENASLARCANRLFHSTGEARFRAMAERALRFVVTPAIARQRPTALALLAADELTREPIHITIVGPHDDATSRALHAVALALPTAGKMVVWWDPRKDPPLPDGVGFPTLDRPAAFLCANGSCSAPLFEPAALERRLRGKPVN